MTRAPDKIWCVFGFSRLGSLKPAVAVLVSVGVACSALAQVKGNQPSMPTNPDVGPPIVSRPVHRPLEITPGRSVTHRGFTKMSRVRYHGPTRFSHPGRIDPDWNRRIDLPMRDPTEPPSWGRGSVVDPSWGGGFTPIDGRVPSIAEPSNPAVREFFGDRPGFTFWDRDDRYNPRWNSDHWRGSYDRGLINHGRSYTRYNRIVDSKGVIVTISSFVGSTGACGISSPYMHNPWDRLRFNGRDFRARSYFDRGHCFDPYRDAYIRPVISQEFSSEGITPAQVLYGQTMTLEQAALARVQEQAQNAASVAASPAEPPEPPELLDEALAAIAADLPEVAAPRLRSHLATNPDDTEARRLLALCMMMDSELPAGLVELHAAYMQDPGLASRPIDVRGLSLRGSTLTDTQTRAVNHAKRNNAPMGYFAAAILQQARGDIRTARRLLNLATDAGLDRELSVPLSAALAP